MLATMARKQQIHRIHPENAILLSGARSRFIHPSACSSHAHLSVPTTVRPKPIVRNENSTALTQNRDTISEADAEHALDTETSEIRSFLGEGAVLRVIIESQNSWEEEHGDDGIGVGEHGELKEDGISVTGVDIDHLKELLAKVNCSARLTQEGYRSRRREGERGNKFNA